MVERVLWQTLWNCKTIIEEGKMFNCIELKTILQDTEFDINSQPLK